MRCKLGNIAFIKKALCPANIGKVVLCKELLGKFEIGEKFTWNGETFLSPDSDYTWVVSSKSDLETVFGPLREALIADSWLTPINGEPSENLEEEIAEDLGKELIHIEK